MNINPNNFLALQEVLADVTVAMDDKEMRKLTPGFYRAQVKYALDELGFDAKFLEVVHDIALPDDLIVPMPKGVYNLKNIRIYTGTPDDVKYVENVYWRRGVQTRGRGTGVVANVNLGTISDPFISAPFWMQGGAFWFSIQNGLIRLSDSCEHYDYVQLVFNGLPSGNLDEAKMIPPEARKAIVLWVTEKCASSLKASDPKYRTVQIDAASQLDEYGFNGAWHEAKSRLRDLDQKQLQDVLEYNAKMNY